jgi:putative transposase
MKSLKIRIFPNYLQEIKINTLSNEHRILYNQLLEQARKGLQSKDLNQFYKNYRNLNNLTINSKSAQNTCRTLINNIKSFFALNKKKNSTAKFPHKFKSWKYFTSFMLDFNQGNGGFKINNNQLELNLNSIKNKLIIDLPEIFSKYEINDSTIKTITFKKEDDKYFIIFVYSEQPSNLILSKDNFLSIDLGCSQIATCFSNVGKCFSNVGKCFSIKNNQFKKLEKRKGLLQSKIDIKKKFSNNWKKIKNRFNKISRKITNKNKDFQHKASREIIDICTGNNIGCLIVGDIKTKKLVTRGRSPQERGKNKSTQNRGTLSRFKGFLEYKAKNLGLDFYKVNEAYTSQENCLTGKREFNSDLSIRRVRLNKFIEIDRDLNSAINIAKRIMGKWFTQVENWSEILTNFLEMYMNQNSKLICI